MGADLKHLSMALSWLPGPEVGRAARRLTQQIVSLSLNRVVPPYVGEGWTRQSIRQWLQRQEQRLLVPTASEIQHPVAPGAGQRSPHRPHVPPEPKQQHRQRHSSVPRRKISNKNARPNPNPKNAEYFTPTHTYIRRRRWDLLKSTAWKFPMLKAAFPFTIPVTAPTSLLMYAKAAPAHHTLLPSGVMIPPGLGTAARKFHSYSLTRQPGAPFSSDEDAGSPMDASAVHAQTLHPDAIVWAMNSAHSKAALRKSDSSANGGNRTRATRVHKSYMFSHAATGIPKHQNRVPLEKQYAFEDDNDGNSEEKLATGVGEDAFFHRIDALGIADGVGGWASVRGADPALFAQRLMHNVSLEVQRYEDIDDEQFSHYYEAAPVDVLRRAYEITLDEMHSRAVKGSSTACVVILRDDELRVANLGDCGLTVVRHGDMIFRTEEQQHSFNFPYQLSTEDHHTDEPSDAQVFRLKVQKGDIVIVGSDGVFDNLFDEDILEEVNQHLPSAMRADGEPELKYSNDSLWYEARDNHSEDRLSAMCENATDSVAPSVSTSDFISNTPPESVTSVAAAAALNAKSRLSMPQFHVDPGAISLAIAQRAKAVSEDTRYAESPFQMRAMQEGLYYQGGKRDDITVVVAVVTDLEDSPDRR